MWHSLIIMCKAHSKLSGFLAQSLIRMCLYGKYKASSLLAYLTQRLETGKQRNQSFVQSTLVLPQTANVWTHQTSSFFIFLLFSSLYAITLHIKSFLVFCPNTTWVSIFSSHFQQRKVNQCISQNAELFSYIKTLFSIFLEKNTFFPAHLAPDSDLHEGAIGTCWTGYTML